MEEIEDLRKLIQDIHEGRHKGEKVKAGIKKSELDKLAQKFNEYSRFKTIQNIRTAYKTRKVPDEDLFIEIELGIAESINAFVYQTLLNGFETQYKILQSAVIRILNDVRKGRFPKMSDHEFDLRCSSIVILVNVNIPSVYEDVTIWEKVLTRYIPT